MTVFDALDYATWPIKDIGFHPLLISMSFALWLIAWKGVGERVASAVFGFSVVFALFWTLWLVQILAIAANGRPINLYANLTTFAKMATALALFAGCALVSTLAVVGRRGLRWPVASVSGLIVAHALHLNVIGTITNKGLDV